MNKDIIYIDVEDDITAIIGKIKASKDKIIALVPPKRVGILQSAVNLRLLNRMAQSSHKRLVLITGNQALVALAANIGIPVAKTLQSKPELPEISALDIDEGEDVIDGASLPVGDHVKMADAKEDEAVESAIDSIDIDDRSVSTKEPKKEDKKSPKTFSGVKVPNFSDFRKKLFLGVGAGVALIAFLIWANIFAPAAHVVITARTSPSVVSTTATLGGNAETNVSKGTIKSVTQQIKKETSVDFDATGEKDFGAKAGGIMTVTRTSISNEPLVVPAGTSFTNSGFTFYSTESVTLEKTEVGSEGLIQDSAEVNVQAAEPGDDYNLSARSYSSDKSGISSEGDNMSGGTTKISKVPTKEDIQTATNKLAEVSEDETKNELIAKFTNGEVVISESFVADSPTPVSTPKLGEEAKDGKAKLVRTTTYTITAIAKPDIQLYLSSELDKQLASKTNQRVYDDGVNEVSLTDYNKKKDSATVRIVTTAKVGPSIDETAVKDMIKGKIYGDAQALLESIEGVSDADVQFSYFWVRTVPGDNSKVTVEFKLEDGE